MRFMLQVRADRDSESGKMPSRELVAEMSRFNQQMVDAGIMLAADGLRPSENGARIAYRGGERTVSRGPIASPEQLIAGFWIIDVASIDEAIEWAKRAPFQAGTVDVRQFFEVTDFPPEVLSAEDAAREQSWRDEHGQAAARRS